VSRQNGFVTVNEIAETAATNKIARQSATVSRTSSNVTTTGVCKRCGFATETTIVATGPMSKTAANVGQETFVLRLNSSVLTNVNAFRNRSNVTEVMIAAMQAMKLDAFNQPLSSLRIPTALYNRVTSSN